MMNLKRCFVAALSVIRKLSIRSPNPSGTFLEAFFTSGRLGIKLYTRLSKFEAEVEAALAKACDLNFGDYLFTVSRLFVTKG